MPTPLPAGIPPMPTRPVPSLVCPLPPRPQLVVPPDCVNSLLVLALPRSRRSENGEIRRWLQQFAEVAADLHDLEAIFMEMSTHRITRGDFNAFSHHGYDVHKGRCVDYGNAQYATLLKFLCFYSSSIYESVDIMAKDLPSLSPTHADTHDGLIVQGDLIECLLGLYRHRDNGGFVGLAADRSQEQIERLFKKLILFSQLVDNLMTVCWGTWMTKRGHQVHTVSFDTLPVEQRLYMSSSSLRMAVVLSEFVRTQQYLLYSA